MAGQWKAILDTDQLGVAGGIAQLDTGGKLKDTQVPSIPSTKITGALSSAQIPNLDASKIVAGTFIVSRIPSLDASKITSGSFGVDRIPTLAQSKITGLITALASKVNTSVKINGNPLTADLNLKTSDMIAKVTSLPASGLEGEIVSQDGKLYVWKDA